MNKYQKGKEAARQKAIDIQGKIPELSLSYCELVELQNYLEKLGREFGLLREFRENGLI